MNENPEPDPQASSPPPDNDRGRGGRTKMLVAPLVAGLVSGCLGLGVAEFVASLTPRLRSPVLDVGDRVIDRVPVWLKDIAIDWFGTNDKIALLAGIGSILAVYAALVGYVALRRSLRLGLVGIALFGLSGTAAALGARTGTDWLSPLPSLLGALVAGAALSVAARLDRSRPATTNAAGPDDRRAFIGAIGAFALGAAALGATARWLGSRFSAAESRAAIRLPRAAQPLAAIPTGTQAPSAAPFITSNADFYRIDTALSVPQVPAESWELRVKGLVDRELRLSYSDLMNREIVEADITLACVSNTIGGELLGTARWLGVRLDDLLDEAGIDPRADQIVGRSVDGYTCGFPVSTLDGREALIAVGMNGEPLPLEHGFPARLIVPGVYGYASATKWLSEIELTTFDAFDHYWVPRGYAAEAPIKLMSRIDTPRGLDRIDAGPFVIGGVAWAQTIGIDAVDIQIDDGPWQATTLAGELTDTTWRQWSLPWEATPGRHTVSVRAIDRNGLVQTDERAEPLPNGAAGHHTVVVLVNE